ncbi:hypothetical protein J2Z22_000832 [Paenibacillus forsythiae]|uniref:SbsA Ig-like domain-containing protein n=1 Tax=Paenibacillus forsythiae TaxID=365616 RepID=A0ABU3H3L7_9BACL|nr:Ig-like domain-containing protein [Paenibacillus forsythiae]MDT3425316.1 hypothetical protein [Paenibacillus forsythiae]
MFAKPQKLISTFVVSLLMLCLLASTAFAADPTVTFNGANLCTISGDTATPGVSLINNTSVPSGLQHIELQFNHNVAANLSTNQNYIHLKNTNTQSMVAITVYRLGDGSPFSIEKRNLFFDANLVSGNSYQIIIDPGLKAYNGYTLGSTQTVDFTVQ